MRQRRSSFFLNRWPIAKFVQIAAGPVRTINSLACEASSNNRLIGPMPVFYPMILLIRTNNTKTETKGKQRLSSRGRGSRRKVCKPKITRVTKCSHKCSLLPISIWKEKDKKRPLLLSLHWPLSKDLGSWLHKYSYLGQRSRDLSYRLLSKQASQPIPSLLQNYGEEKLFLYSPRPLN